MKKDKSQQSGFTIVELLIVIVIIGILATIGFVSYKRIIDKGQAAATRNIVQQYSKVFGAFYADNGRYPEYNDLDTAEIAALPEVLLLYFLIKPLAVNFSRLTPCSQSMLDRSQ